MTNSNREKVDFDQYATDYENLLKQQLQFFSSDRSYFSEYKAATLSRIAPLDGGRLLDFGSGIGLTIPHLKRHFPGTEICATDISKESLRLLRDRFPDVNVLDDEEIDTQRFDTILIATVMHHVEPSERLGLIKRLERLLVPGGRICIFEHNPYNPVTRRMVATCPFDEDAILLTMKESKKLLTASGVMKLEKSGYTLFFPNVAAPLRRLEPWLEWLPLGGQYYTLASRR